MEKNQNNYGNGRKAMAMEMIDYCNKQIAKIKSHPLATNKAVLQKRAGVISGYRSVIIQLQVKLQKMDARKQKD